MSTAPAIPECSICFNAFSRNVRRPMVGKCGHTVCLICSLRLKFSNCPHCRRELAFIIPPTNYALLEQLEEHGQGSLDSQEGETSSVRALLEEHARNTSSNDNPTPVDHSQQEELGCFARFLILFLELVFLVPLKIILIMLMLIFLLFATPIYFLSCCCCSFRTDFLEDFDEIPCCECFSFCRRQRHTEEHVV